MDTSILDMVDNADVCSLTFLTAILLLSGHWLVGNDQVARKRGASIGAAVFVFYLIYGVWSDGFLDVQLLIIRVLRGGIAAGMCIACMWMLLPYVTAFERRREETLRHRNKEQERRRAKQDEERKEAEKRESLRRRQEEEARLAPARRQQQLTESEKVERESTLRKAEHGQREMARFECQLLYDRHADSLNRLFPRDRFDAFVQQWLTPDRNAADVQHHAKRLCELIVDLASQAAPTRKRFGSLREISEHFASRRNEVLAGSYDAETETTLIAAINDHETAAFTEFLKT